MDAKPIFLHALSPLHAGTGQGVDVIDLPIARERATSLPILPGSSLKGVLRDRCENTDLRTKIFGPDTDNAELHAGSVQITDMRLLLMPIRSLAGTFAWITCPLVLHRFQRDLALVDGANAPAANVPKPNGDQQCLVYEGRSALTLADSNQIVLEDMDLIAEASVSAKSWADWLGKRLFPDDPDWQAALQQRFCVVSDTIFGFLMQTATEITARIRLEDDSKTVAKGALWYEESLPAESILSGLVVIAPVKAADVEKDKIVTTLQTLTGKPLQVGGNATVGRGFCRVRIP